MKKLFFLFGFIFLFSNLQAQELAYAETTTPSLQAGKMVDIVVTRFYRDSLFWVVDVDLRPIEGASTTSSASFKVKQQQSYFKRGSKGVGSLELTGRKTGRLSISKMGGQSFTKPKTVNLTFKGRTPRL
jgi:hypothetical protein